MTNSSTCMTRAAISKFHHCYNDVSAGSDKTVHYVYPGSHYPQHLLQLPGINTGLWLVHPGQGCPHAHLDLDIVQWEEQSVVLCYLKSLNSCLSLSLKDRTYKAWFINECNWMINDSDEDTIIYNKKCDMQSLRIIMYILFCGYTPFSVHYGYEYSGDKEENCTVCHVTFPEAHWSEIYLMARSLILQLLTKHSAQRLTTEELLSHPCNDNACFSILVTIYRPNTRFQSVPWRKCDRDSGD